LELIPEKRSLWTESLLWDKDITLRGGAGYKDNVLLSPSSPHGSAFYTSGLDLLVFRLPLDGLAFNLAMTGDDVRYARAVDGVEGEDSFLATAQIQKPFQEQWRSGLELKYLYLDQVAQELIQTGGVRTVVAKGHTLGVRPFIRRDLATNWWVQLEFPVSREWWQSPLDDEWKFGAQAIAGRSYGFNSQAALTYGGLYISHDDWLAREADGMEIPGTTLALWQQNAELKWEHHWDAAQLWRSTTKLGFQYTQDNGSGFFDYYRYSLSEEVRFGTKNWEIKGSAAVSYYDFPVQPSEIPPPLVDFPTQPVQPTTPGSKLQLTTLNLAVRVERRVYNSFRLFGAYAYERVLSNQSDSEYTANVVSGGVSWEF
jgi:hypothetical protein